MANPASFDYANKGPFGICLNQQLQTTFDENVAFSDSSWENAKQNCQYGCVLPPGIPQWPPGVTPLSASPNFTNVQKMTDAQLVNTLQSKPFQFDSPFVAKKEYSRFVPNDSPAVVRSLENRCGIPKAIEKAVATQAINKAIGAPTQISPMPPVMTSPEIKSANMVSMFFKSMVEAVKGMSYDAKNWSQLPGDTMGQKLNFMLTHDQDRVTVLVLSIILLFSVIAFIVLVSLAGCSKC